MLHTVTNSFVKLKLINLSLKLTKHHRLRLFYFILRFSVAFRLLQFVHLKGK